MSRQPRSPDHNVVQMPANQFEAREPLREYSGAAAAAKPPVTAGSPDDPRMQEALRLMEAFLAIEDKQGRAALITLAESLVSFDWVRKAQQR